ncbi:MAG: cupin domain-containing protein [Campylobacter sp.]|nr:cupin domain-containing protein [Campylobacter sp.]
MIKNIKILALSMLLAASLMAADEKAQFTQIFELGEINPYSKYFTGKTYLRTFDDGKSGRNANISNVTFEPCARTDWHYHTGGQALIITAGSGIFKSEGKKARIIEAGDVVKIDPNEKHFHAGGATTWMAHISVMASEPENKTVWLEKVSDEEYQNAVAEAIKQPN